MSVSLLKAFSSNNVKIVQKMILREHSLLRLFTDGIRAHCRAYQFLQLTQNENTYIR